jgi:type I restriction enzyme M protein
MGQLIPFVPPGRIRCYITGKLRRDTPEENVRQRWARSLVEEYKYNKSDIALEFPINMGVATKKADIVVFREGAAKKQENIFLIVEAKRAEVLPKSTAEGVGQLKSYMAASSSCRYGLWVGSERQGFEKVADGTILEGISDIPSKGDLEPRVPLFTDLVAALDLKATFRRCHNYIYANQGFQKAEAFHEMLKLIFCKVYDETESTGELGFYVRNEERRSEAGQRRLKVERIDPLFAAVKDRYPYIFKPEETVQLNLRVLAYIVSELQRISLLGTNTDVKGAAYEELVGENLRGARGEYFTPRNVCDMAVRIIAATYPHHRLTALHALDLCCGTGGFLVSYLNHLRQVLTAAETAKTGGSTARIGESVAARVKDICSHNLYGLDINPFLVRTSQMNLVMHGDGSANVFQADSLLSPGEWDDREAAQKVGHGRFDVVVTNPPFGGDASVDDPHLLSRYDLASFGVSSMRKVLPAEQLFVEAALNFLRPGGRLAIVLPDSILNNPGLEFIRRWLVRRTRIIASVDLPKETFATSGGVPNPSVLVVQKLTREEVRLAEAGALDSYEVFMAIPKTAGIDKRGNPVYRRTPEGVEIVTDSSTPIVHDEISLVADGFIRWIRERGYVRE